MSELLPQAVEDELREALQKRRSGAIVIEFHEGSITKAKFEPLTITWERTPRGDGRVERG